jgi:hypothetical protein
MDGSTYPQHTAHPFFLKEPIGGGNGPAKKNLQRWLTSVINAMEAAVLFQ